MFAWQSFYLPGSLNTEDAILEDWNIQTPPLYLWSRADWADKHRAIAKQHGHTTPWTLPMYQPTLYPKKERSLSPPLPPKKELSIKQEPAQKKAIKQEPIHKKSIKQEPTPKLKQEPIQKPSLPLDDQKNQPVDPPGDKNNSHSNENIDKGAICKSNDIGLENDVANVAHCCSTGVLDSLQKHEVTITPGTDKIVDKTNHELIVPIACKLGDQSEEKDSKKRNRGEDCDNLDGPKVQRESKESKNTRDYVKKEPDIQLNLNDGTERNCDGRKRESGPNGGTDIRKDVKDTSIAPRMSNGTRGDRSVDKNDWSGLDSRRMGARVNENNGRGEVRHAKKYDKVEPNHQKYSTERRSYDRDRPRRSSSNSKDCDKIINDKMKMEGTRFREIAERQDRHYKSQDRKRGFENGETIRSPSPRKKPRVVDESNRKSYRDFLRSTLHVELPRQASDPYNVSKDGHIKPTYHGEDNVRDSRHRNDARLYEKELNDDRRRRSSRRSRSFEEKSDIRASRQDPGRYNSDVDLNNMNDNNRQLYQRQQQDSMLRQQQDSTLPKWYTMKPGGGVNKLEESDKLSDVESPPRQTQVARHMDMQERSSGVHEPSPQQRFATKISEYNCGRNDEFDGPTYCDSYPTKFLDFLKDPALPPQDAVGGSFGKSCYTDMVSPHQDIYGSAQFSNYRENQYPQVEPSWKSSSILDMHHQPQDLPSTQLNFNVGQYGCLDNVYSTGYMDTLPRPRVDEPFFPTDQRFMHASDPNFNGMSLVGGPQMSQGLTQNGLLSRPVLPSHPYPCGDYSRADSSSLLSSEPLYRSLLPPMSQQDIQYISGMAPSQPWHDPLMFSHPYA